MPQLSAGPLGCTVLLIIVLLFKWWLSEGIFLLASSLLDTLSHFMRNGSVGLQVGQFLEVLKAKQISGG